MKKYDLDNRDDRKKIIESALASNRAEGIEPDAETVADLAAFVAGEIDIHELKRRARERYF